MKTQAVIFDKDGTLISFNDFWVPISYGAIEDILRAVKNEDIPTEEILSGLAAVSAYAVMSYAVYTFDYVFQGVCDGVQPIISYCCGAKDDKVKGRVVKQSTAILMLFAALSICMTPMLISLMPKLFAVSDEAEDMMKRGLIIYAVSYPFKAAVKFICSYYYASSKIKLSNLLIYADPIILTPLFLVVLPKVMGIDGIWLSHTFAQVVVTISGVMLSVLLKRFENNLNS